VDKSPISANLRLLIISIISRHRSNCTAKREKHFCKSGEFRGKSEESSQRKVNSDKLGEDILESLYRTRTSAEKFSIYL